MRSVDNEQARLWRATRHGVGKFLLVALTLSLLLQAGAASAQSPPADAGLEIYLSQAQPALADAQTNLQNLQYYLPLASVNDANDPTWDLAQEAADAAKEDADMLATLDPPDPLAAVNAALVSALDDASASADQAIIDLSSGDTAAGQLDLQALNAAIDALANAASSLPQPRATPVEGP
jgi:hypothetical protein